MSDQLHDNQKIVNIVANIIIQDEKGELYEIVDRKIENKIVGNNDEDSVIYRIERFIIKKKIVLKNTNEWRGKCYKTIN
jgi:hypothetical protein